jgi:hypothetical protein
MIETTDCLEAVGVFRGWKNFFFLIAVICLLLSQASFWLVDTRFVEAERPATLDVSDLGLDAAAADVLADVNDTGGSTTSSRPRMGILAGLNFQRLARATELVNGILIVTASLYCLAMFFSLMVSLIGRLGGINHMSRAFFLSLIMLVLVVPWQKLLGASVVGVTYAPIELAEWFADKTDNTVNIVVYYLRFTGYWLIVMVLLFMSQVRSARWTKAILRRLEII